MNSPSVAIVDTHAVTIPSPNLDIISQNIGSKVKSITTTVTILILSIVRILNPFKDQGVNEDLHIIAYI